MVKHIIIWTLKSELTADEKTEAVEKIKMGLEGLDGRINGLLEIKVQNKLLSSSSGDLMLDSTFINEDALKGYQTNPEHLKVAGFVRSVTESRKCVDFEI